MLLFRIRSMNVLARTMWPVTVLVLVLMVGCYLLDVHPRSIGEQQVSGEAVASQQEARRRDVTYQNTSSFVGLHQEDELLIQTVKIMVMPPTDRSDLYNLDQPKKTYFSQFKQDKLVDRVFRGKTKGFFFEAGALEGERLSNTLFLERQREWTGVLVEPIRKSFRQIMTKNRKAHALNACLAPNTTASILFMNKSSKSLALSALLSDTEKSKGKTAVSVPCFPLFTILQAFGNPVVDYLSLDIEGPEMKVLKTVPWDKVKIRFLGIEINHVPEGREAVKKYMLEQGFKFYMLQKIDYFFYDPKLSNGMDLSLA